jgi:hypothetical protein
MVASIIYAKRLTWLAAAAATIVAGLVWRWPALGLPPFAAKYGGSALWGTMVFFLVAALRPSARVRNLAFTAAAIAAAVEFSQAIHVDWLDAFRSHTVGHLLLGTSFSWWDIVAYWAGIGVTWFALFTKLSANHVTPIPAQ